MAKRRYTASFGIAFKLNLPKDLYERFMKLKKSGLEQLNGSDFDVDRSLATDIVASIESMCQVFVRVRAISKAEKRRKRKP